MRLIFGLDLNENGSRYEADNGRFGGVGSFFDILFGSRYAVESIDFQGSPGRNENGKRQKMWTHLMWWRCGVVVVFSWQAAAACLAAVAFQNLNDPVERPREQPYVMVLGVAQDAGYPQAGCWKPCCQPAWEDRSVRRYPTCLAIVDPISKQRWLLDCTWQLPDQLHMLNTEMPRDDSPGLDGIFLTHGHIGHYTGLMHLGREVMGTDRVPVFAMPRMRDFLATNGPWDLLLELNHIVLQPLELGQEVVLNERLSLTALSVPHRGEYSETVAFVVRGPQRSVLYLPDIDKWSRWERSIETLLGEVDIAFLDATFFANGEIAGRDMSQIPHPFVEESIVRFQPLDAETRKKVHFIHLNHSNPALHLDSQAAEHIRRAGLNLAEQGAVYGL